MFTGLAFQDALFWKASYGSREVAIAKGKELLADQDKIYPVKQVLVTHRTGEGEPWEAKA